MATNQNGQFVLNLTAVCLTVDDSHANVHL